MKQIFACFSVVFFAALFLLPSPSNSKVYTKCGLTQELIKLHFPRSFIGNWLCLIESESFKNTSKLTFKANGSKSYGLFQINDKQWCVSGRKGGGCSVKCEDLINEDLRDDAACAQRIWSQTGFQGWEGWKRSCYMRNLSNPKC